MPILFILTLLNLAALCALVVSKSLGIKWVAALYSLFFTLIGGWIWTGSLSENPNLCDLHFSGYNYIFGAYSLLAVACVSVVVTGVLKERTGFIVLGLIVFAVTAFITWLGYELVHTSWKIGG